MKYLMRLYYNTDGWKNPSGVAQAKEVKGSYPRQFGFGYGEWLLRDEWDFDGWSDTFVQEVNKSRKRLLNHEQPFDLHLFSIEPKSKRRYVGAITEVECLSDQQAQGTLELFQRNGWFQTMCNEIAELGHNLGNFGHERYAPIIFNIRFRLDNVTLYDAGEYSKLGDPIIERCKRYQLYSVVVQRDQALSTKRKPAGAEFITIPKIKSATRTITYQRTYEHARVEGNLLRQLWKVYSPNMVLAEREYIDIVVESQDCLILYEINSDTSPRSVLWHSIGQLLEYACHALASKKAIRLIAAGRQILCSDDEEYLSSLRSDFSLLLSYLRVSLG
ncbi:hypothetical protein [Pseudomonas sp. Irchel s3h9]|uniref:hypothetical protein n=1 Tax=Pseudomonas sp. Irchel s3h9 TaxID=2009192 RepID=UPI000BA4DD9B|nr:hypothetical protein [Pseudomonas sp. Irchel s3h9]